jgi:hypothetical protein
MLVTSKDFFDGLRVDSKYYLKVFINNGVKSRFIFDSDDLTIISSCTAFVKSYKSSLIAIRAKSLLGGVECQN